MKQAESKFVEKAIRTKFNFLFLGKLLTNVIDELLKEEEEEKQQTQSKDFMNSKNLLHLVEKSISNFGTNQSIKKEIKRKRKLKCNCLPSCTSLNYNIETSQSDWEWYKQFEALSRDLDDYEIDQM